MLCVDLGTVQCKMVPVHSRKPVYSLPLSEKFPQLLPLKEIQWWSDGQSPIYASSFCTSLLQLINGVVSLALFSGSQSSQVVHRCKADL